MKQIPLLFSLLFGCAIGQTVTCPSVISAKNDFYIGPDNQILGIKQFSTDPKPVPNIVVPYLKRLSHHLAQRGTKLILVLMPNAGFNYVGNLDSKVISGTAFESASALNNLKPLQTVYTNTLQDFNITGIQTVNVIDALLKSKQSNPNQQYYFLHDAHWHPNAAHVVAQAIFQQVKEENPELVDQLHTEDLQVNVIKMTQRISLGGWDGTIRQYCPEHQPLPEPFPVLSLNAVPGGQQPDLLTDLGNPALLLGTSFSGDNPQFGFGLFLSAAFGTPFLNLSISGGGPLDLLQKSACVLQGEIAEGRDEVEAERESSSAVPIDFFEDSENLQATDHMLHALTSGG